MLQPTITKLQLFQALEAWQLCVRKSCIDILKSLTGTHPLATTNLLKENFERFYQACRKARSLAGQHQLGRLWGLHLQLFKPPAPTCDSFSFLPVDTVLNQGDYSLKFSYSCLTEDGMS